jgi:hypothetical protein
VVVMSAVVALGICGAAYASSGDLSHPVTIRTVERGGNQEFLMLNKTSGDATAMSSLSAARFSGPAPSNRLAGYGDSAS